MAAGVLILSSSCMSSLLSKATVSLEVSSPVLNVFTNFSTFFFSGTRQIGQQSCNEMVKTVEAGQSHYSTCISSCARWKITVNIWVRFQARSHILQVITQWKTLCVNCGVKCWEIILWISLWSSIICKGAFDLKRQNQMRSIQYEYTEVYLQVCAQRIFHILSCFFTIVLVRNYVFLLCGLTG